MKAVIINANIRGCESKQNKKGEGYLLVRYEEAGTGAPMTIVDKDMSRQGAYKRDTCVDLYIDIDEGRNFTTIRVIDVKPANSTAPAAPKAAAGRKKKTAEDR